MTTNSLQYAVGYWESLWPSEPYMRHRFLVDMEAKAVIAGQSRAYHCWTDMSVEDLAYMQQILEETFSDFFDDLRTYEFNYVGEFPPWSTAPWPWSRLNDIADF